MLFTTKTKIGALLHLFPAAKITMVMMLLILIAAPLQLALSAPASQQTAESLVDVAWYQTEIVAAADRWNGGLDGRSGMGAYGAAFNGYFHVQLDQRWRRQPFEASTAVAQSRAIYMNVEAYRAASDEDKPRFLQAATHGADFLLEHFQDAENGGYFWMVTRSGRIFDDLKQGYGNVHPLFALAHLYDISDDPKYLEGALDQLAVIEEHFLDPDYPGGFRPNYVRDFSQIVGVNNVDVITHYFEALLALYDVTEGDTQAHIADLITESGNFIVNHLYHEQEGFTDRGYLAYNYDEEWQPSQIPYTRDLQWAGAMHATTGHNIEIAYLLSRAIERGFDPEWLATADKLLKFCLEYAMHPEYGGMIYDITDYEGQPLEGNPDNPIFIWWPQAETARALLHFTVVRGEDYSAEFAKVATLFHDYLTDHEYGGLYHGLDAEHNLEPVGLSKGDIWKVNYHYTMFFAEVLRLGNEYPEQLAALND